MAIAGTDVENAIGKATLDQKFEKQSGVGFHSGYQTELQTYGNKPRWQQQE
jgi:hypothetical protein